MNHQDREPSSRGGGGGKGSGGGGEEQTPPASGSATATSSGGGAAPSASATTTQRQQNASGSTNTNVSANTSNISNANHSNNSGTNATTQHAHTAASAVGGSARGSSTESESAARREYVERRRLANVPSDDEDEDDDEDDEEDEEEEEEEEEDMDGVQQHQQQGQNVNQSMVHSHTSSSSGSPVQRLPSMLRAPVGSQQQPPSSGAAYGRGFDVGAASSPTLYGLHPRQQPQYYESMYTPTGPSQMSPRDALSPTGTMAMDGSRQGLAQKRRLSQSSSSQQPMQPSSASGFAHSSGNPTSRVLYEASQHHASSNSSSSTARSGGGHNSGGSGMSSSRVYTDNDGGSEDPLRFETRGSHGPRDEARYETWTSKQLRKKCSHLKLRGLKNVKKHVMVEALYRYYRNQRGKQQSSSNAPSESTHVRGGGASSSGNGTHSTSNGHSTSVGHTTSNSNSGGTDRGGASNDGGQSSQRRFHDAYAPSSSQRYDASTSSSNYLANAVAASLLRGNRSSGGGGNNSNNTQQQQQIGRRSSPSSSAGLTMRPPQRSSSLGGGEARNAGYNTTVDVEESKYDMPENEVRITSEDVIRLVDVILSPEFVDRLTGELSRWQFWVDIREKYVSLVSVTSASNYGAARGLTALGGDHHQGQGDRPQGHSSNSGGAGVDRLSMSSGYVRPSAKWSSMQLWEMWKELTFAYTKTCFEFTAAGVDERNYIQFCEGRPDVYYLHQRLHARPDLLHLIKSNEYIEEKCSSDVASEHTAEKNAANALMGVSTPGGQRPHKRFKRIVPTGSGAGGGSVSGGGGSASVAGSVPAIDGPPPSASSTFNAGGNQSDKDGSGGKSGPVPAAGVCDSGASGDNGTERLAVSQNAGAGGRASASNGDARQYLGQNGMRGAANDSPSGQQEEGSTENSETTGEDNSMEKTNSNTASSDSTRREALAEQKYFGLLLQNFEAIFESLHNKKVLLAALRKDSSAPDHLVADLHDDIHVLSALKKDFRNKLRQALE